ncbi:MAG TPA: RNA polymerase sigma factor [Solirubrobacteraceae bacterium]|jgi:RNA polymerase sigma-70 factor (ECF subfamily)|nr:RNA polymerase sigma factor [Solirubrobacteraceae bacterium]
MSGLFKRPARPSSEDDERFTRLYEDTSRDLLAFLLRRCATAEDAADCLAETYRIAWETRARIPAGHEARPWLFGVARNITRQTHRGETRRAATTSALATAAERWYTPSGPEDGALAAALSQLSPIDQEIITMIAADELPPREVATILGLSPNAVRIRAHRAREKLRALLGPTAPEEGADPADARPVAEARGG